MEFCPVEEPLYRRRLRSAAPKSLEGDLQIAPPSYSNDVELDPDVFKNKPDIKEWVYKSALKISSRPSLTFSPSFLLSPICFSPLMIDDELLSPFACVNQAIGTPWNTPDISTKSIEATTSVFSFDCVEVDVAPVSPTNCFNLSRTLCAIPEDRELSTLELEMAKDSIQNQILEFRKAGISPVPPQSPSIAIATKSKAKSVQTNPPELRKSKKNERDSSCSESQKARDKCQDREGRKNGTTLVKGFQAKRRSGNSIFLSMVSR